MRARGKIRTNQAKSGTGDSAGTSSLRTRHRRSGAETINSEAVGPKLAFQTVPLLYLYDNHGDTTFDHGAARQRNTLGRRNSEFLGGSRGDSTAGVSMVRKRDGNRWRDIIHLQNFCDNFIQWGTVHRDGEQHRGNRDE